MAGWIRVLHAISVLVLAVAVPIVVYLVNGTVEPWAFVLGGVIGFAWWYWGPWLPF